MKIENIVVSNIDINNNSATLTFDIVELEGEVNVNLKVNDGEFKQILEKQKQGTITYKLTDIPKGINNLVLKIANENEEYLTEPFLVKLKINPTIEGLECTYSDSTGKFILEFNLLGDELFIYNIYLKLDENEYQEIMTSQAIGKKTFEMISVMGEHTCVLKVTDNYDEYETEIYSFEITNKKPILSMVLVTDVTNEGVANIHYAVKDIENSTLEHKLNIDSEEKIINPTRIDNFYTYEINNLSIGVHECSISVTDGIDTVTTDSFNIEIFENSTDKKEILRQSKSRYDSAYQSLKNIIMSIVSDGVFNYDIENTIIQKAQEHYNETYSEFNKVAQQSIDTIGTNKINLTKDDLTNQIDDVDNALNTLETTMEGVFKDGILSDSEKTLLKDNLNLIAKEKTDVDKDYETLYNNEDLLDPAKSKLQTTYNAFVDAQNTLSTTINNIINKEGIIDNEDKANVDSAFESWRNALGDYRNASLEAIDSIAKKKIDDNADTLDKKWSQLIIDVETGIKAEVGSLETEVGNITQKVAELEITDKSITSTVSSMNSTISTHTSQIKQLSNSITSSVTEDDVKSIIEQSPTEIKYGFNDISDYVTISTSGLTVSRGSIACDMITNYSSNAIIRLFQGNGLDMSIDATSEYETGVGDSIRLKRDGNNYIRVEGGYISFYCSGSGGNNYAVARMRGATSGTYFGIQTKGGDLVLNNGTASLNGTKFSMDGHTHSAYSLTSHTHSAYAPSSHTHSYAPSSHTHSGYASSSYFTSDGSTTRMKYSSSNYVQVYDGSEVELRAGSARVYLTNYGAYSLYPYSSSTDLGASDSRWRYIYSANALNTCDKKYKENIVYIDELLNVRTFSLFDERNTVELQTPFLDFMKNDFRPALYNYLCDEEQGYQLADDQLGFIANDIKDTEIGGTFLYNYGTDDEDDIMFSMTGYTTVVARALQEEIMVRENKISELEMRIEELENKLNNQ